MQPLQPRPPNQTKDAEKDPENDAQVVRSPLRSPLVNRLPKGDGGGEAAGSKDEHLQELEARVQRLSTDIRCAVGVLYHNLKPPSKEAFIAQVLDSMSMELGEDVVKGVANSYTRTHTLVRPPSAANIRRLKRVCIVGAAGFLASHIVAMMLELGIEVVGTVQDAEGPDVEHLKGLEGTSKLTLVASDMQEASLMKAFQGCDTVIHTAWPAVEGDENIVQLAVRMTSTVMKAAAASTTVRHVVLTSSTAAVRFFAPLRDPANGYNGDDWSDQEKLAEHKMHRALAVTLAEEAAWQAHSELLVSSQSGNGKKMKLATICLGQLFGPPLQPQINAGSTSIIEYLSGEQRVVEKSYLHYVDVRDAARAHVLAAQHNYQGRLLCVGGVETQETLCRALLNLEPSSSVPTDVENRLLGPPDVFDTREVQALGLDFTDFRTMVADTVAGIKEKGWWSP